MNLEILKELNLDIVTNASLSSFTTFRLGGSCPYLVFCTRPIQLEKLISELVGNNEDLQR